MKFKKFILIPILLVGYIFLVQIIGASLMTSSSTAQGNGSGAGQVINMGQSIQIYVTRPYLFGLVRLPIYINGTDVSFLHDAYFTFVFILLGIFIFIEITNWWYHLGFKRWEEKNPLGKPIEKETKTVKKEMSVVNETKIKKEEKKPMEKQINPEKKEEKNEDEWIKLKEKWRRLKNETTKLEKTG